MNELNYLTGELNKRRKTNKWYSYVGTINGKDVRIKGYRTWLQIFRVDGVDCSNCMEESVKQFNSAIAAAF